MYQLLNGDTYCYETPSPTNTGTKTPSTATQQLTCCHCIGGQIIAIIIIINANNITLVLYYRTSVVTMSEFAMEYPVELLDWTLVDDAIHNPAGMTSFIQASTVVQKCVLLSRATL